MASPSPCAPFDIVIIIMRYDGMNGTKASPPGPSYYHSIWSKVEVSMHGLVKGFFHRGISILYELNYVYRH